MRTTLAFKGVTEMILERAVETGLARSKTDALRMGVFALNREYQLVKDVEQLLLEKKLKKEETKAKREGIKFLPKDEALAKYR